MAFLNVLPGSVVPQIEVLVDFDNDPTAGTTTWTDVTPYVTAYSRAPVRTNEFDQPGVTSGAITFRNDDGRFSPDNANGTYFGKLKKTRRVRVRAQWGTVVWNRFTGYIDDWPQSWAQAGKDPTVTVPLRDGFEPVSLFDLVGLDFGAAQSGTALRSVLSAAGVTAMSLDAGISAIPDSGTLSSTLALQRIHDISATENGVTFPDGGGTIQFHDRHHRLITNASATAMGTIGDTAGEIPYVDPQPLFGDSWNVTRVTPNGGTVQTNVVASGTAAHFQRTLSFPPAGTYLVSDAAEALSAAQYLGNRYSEPSTRVQSVTLVPARNPSVWPTVLNLDTSTKVKFRRRAFGGTIETDQFVEGYGDQVTIGQDWRILLPMSPADIQSYWVLGDPLYGLLGDTTILGY
jgi:hypothetical protein